MKISGMADRAGSEFMQLGPDVEVPDDVTVRIDFSGDPGIAGSPARIPISDVRLELSVDMSEFRDLVAVWQRAFAAVATELGAIFRRFASAANAACAACGVLADAGVTESPLPVDPKARALELRRRRNTGPSVARRAPKRIDPTRGDGDWRVAQLRRGPARPDWRRRDVRPADRRGLVKPVRPVNFLPAGWHPTWPPSNTDIARVEPGFDGDGNIVEISLVDGPKP